MSWPLSCWRGLMSGEVPLGAGSIREPALNDSCSLEWPLMGKHLRSGKQSVMNGRSRSLAHEPSLANPRKGATQPKHPQTSIHELAFADHRSRTDKCPDDMSLTDFCSQTVHEVLLSIARLAPLPQVPRESPKMEIGVESADGNPPKHIVDRARTTVQHSLPEVSREALSFTDR